MPRASSADSVNFSHVERAKTLPSSTKVLSMPRASASRSCTSGSLYLTLRPCAKECTASLSSRDARALAMFFLMSDTRDCVSGTGRERG